MSCSLPMLYTFDFHACTPSTTHVSCRNCVCLLSTFAFVVTPYATACMWVLEDFCQLPEPAASHYRRNSFAAEESTNWKKESAHLQVRGVDVKHENIQAVRSAQLLFFFLFRFLSSFLFLSPSSPLPLFLLLLLFVYWLVYFEHLMLATCLPLHL